MNMLEDATNKYMCQHDLSLRAFYKLIGISAKNHPHYCKGVMPNIKTAYKFSKVLSVPIWELWGLE